MYSEYRQIRWITTTTLDNDNSAEYRQTITKTYRYNFDPIQPHFYIVKLGFTGVYITLISAQKHSIDCRYSLEPPRRGGFNEYPQSMFLAKIWQISQFLSENFQVLVLKFSFYLNRRVFVMQNNAGWRQIQWISLVRKITTNTVHNDDKYAG